jgi:hypothetical protein
MCQACGLPEVTCRLSLVVASFAPNLSVMSNSGGRNFLTSVIGWLIVAVVVWVFFGGIFGAIRFIVRAVVFLVVVGALLSLYFRLRSGGGEK